MESLVFIIGGMLLGTFVVNDNKLELVDIGYMFIMFPSLYLIRLIVVVFHYPWIANIGYGLN